MKMIVKACIILHNMIIDEEKDENDDERSGIAAGRDVMERVIDLSSYHELRFRPAILAGSLADMCARAEEIRREEDHFILHDASVEHHWAVAGSS
jgi:hypothetical protein